MSKGGRHCSLHARALVAGGLLAVSLAAGSLGLPTRVQAAGGEPSADRAGTSSSSACHPNERWPVKTGTDADAGKVDLSKTTSTSIAFMDHLAPPSTFPPNRRIPPVETTVYSVTATLVQYQKMADQDYHLVLRDSSGRKLLVEVPDPACVGSSSPFLPDIGGARAAVDARLQVTRTSQSASIPVTVRGVGFWDGKTGGGVHIELHPVLNITFS